LNCPRFSAAPIRVGLSVEGCDVGLLELRGRHHPKSAVQAAVVVPVDPAGGGVLDVTDGPVAAKWKTVVRMHSVL
jgi:hypothetical protein